VLVLHYVGDGYNQLVLTSDAQGGYLTYRTCKELGATDEVRGLTADQLHGQFTEGLDYAEMNGPHGNNISMCQLAAGLQAAVSRAPRSTRPFIVFRGQRALAPWRDEKHRKHVSRRIISTSLLPYGPIEFATKDPGGKGREPGYLFVFHLEAGVPCLAIGGLGEYEVLLGTGALFERVGPLLPMKVSAIGKFLVQHVLVTKLSAGSTSDDFKLMKGGPSFQAAARRQRRPPPGPSQKRRKV
jgi:hypothetical protein